MVRMHNCFCRIGTTHFGGWFFNCDGEGLPMEELENLKYDIDSILDFCGWDSPPLAERYQGFKQEEDELGAFNSRGGLGM